MEVLSTIIGKHLNNTFSEGVAFHIALFLEPSDEEQEARLKRLTLRDTVEHKTLKGKITTFPKYIKKSKV